MAPASNLKSSSRFRVKKFSRTTPLSVHKEEEIDSTEYESLHHDKFDTGVEKAEEKEYHLQAALNATSGGAAEEIPAPKTEESADIDYDKLYEGNFKQPASYIRFSQTVEESTGCQYDMTTDDNTFLIKYNQRGKGGQCEPIHFEMIMEAFEDTAAEQAPFAAIDGSPVLSFESMQLALKQQVVVEKVIKNFAKDIYEHWKARRQAVGNHPLQPSLKFEKNQELDDGDPYVCFRRRDARQTRKTRNRDVQSTEKLKKLRKELEEGRELIRLAYQREVAKRDLLKLDKEVFENRARLKDTKVKLGIKGDDEDLINQRPQKRKHSEFAQRPQGQPVRLPGRSDGRAIDADLVLLSDLLTQKENLLQSEIDDKVEQHRKWNLNHVDLTREPLPAVPGPETSFRPATAQYQYLMTPPSSVTSDSLDQGSPVADKSETAMLRFASPPPDDEPRGQPAYRRRIGRGGRLWIDRRGMSAGTRSLDADVADRFKYDHDDDDEPPTYEYDPYDLKALKFRATIPLPAHLHLQRSLGQNTRPNGSSPNAVRAIAAPQPAPPTQPTPAQT